MKYIRYSIYIIIGMILLAFCLFYKTNENVIEGKNEIVAVDFFKENMTIEKQFIPQQNVLNSLGIRFATYNQSNNKGIINIRILAKENKEEIYNQDIDIKDIIDNNYYFLYFDNQILLKNKSYKIVIHVKEISKDSKIGIWGYFSNENKLIINGKEKQTDYSITYKTRKHDYQMLLYLFFYVNVIAIIEVIKEKK